MTSSAHLDGVDLLGIRSRTRVTRRVVEACGDKLHAVGAFCIGTNQMDLDALAEAGVPAFNAPYSNTRSVVELVMAEIIALARRLGDRNTQMHNGVWRKSAIGSHEIRGRRLGIIGYGNIGQQLSVVAEAMGMQVFFYDIADVLPMGNAHKCDSMEELLGSVETVSLHIDGRPSNTDLIGDREFAMMRPRSLFLNLSRGKVVDINALVDNPTYWTHRWRRSGRVSRRAGLRKRALYLSVARDGQCYSDPAYRRVHPRGSS